MKMCPECRATYHEASPVCPADGASLLDIAADDARCGTVLDDRYVILGRLGAGGMGTVYTAWQISTGRTVALKLLAEAISDNSIATERFMREARMTAGLSSPHVVRVHDFGQLEDTTAYIAMEWIDGEPLEDLINGPMPPARAIELVRQVCIALEEAHGQGLVHRDLKPANIIVRQLADGGDFAQVLDFGIAKVLDETQTALTHESQNPGTPAYMSPEQARNEPVGPPTDLYALAVILFEMLVGERPFTGTSAMSVLLQHVQATPPSLKSRLPDLPGVEAIDAVLQQGLAKKVSDRYASAQALRADLDRLKTGIAPEALTHPALKPSRGFGWNMQALGCSVQLAIAVGALAFFVLPVMRDDAPSEFDDIVRGEPTASAVEEMAASARSTALPAKGGPPQRGAPSPKPKDAKAKDSPIALDDAKASADAPALDRADAVPTTDLLNMRRAPDRAAGVGSGAGPNKGSGGSPIDAKHTGADDRAEDLEAEKDTDGPAASVADSEAPAGNKEREEASQKTTPRKKRQRAAGAPSLPRPSMPDPSPPIFIEKNDTPPMTPGASIPTANMARRRARPPPATAAELERQLRAAAPKLRANCGPGLWPLEVLIDIQGRVQRVRITQPGRAAHAQARCALSTVRALTFPAPARPVPLRLML
ncbi:MAG: hypothetical protein ACI9U2_003563 [Bradymonadia bacterium]|jgi:hypothetical protein